MGDMADWINDNGMLDELLYGSGGTKSCKYCGKGDLSWSNIGSRNHPIWRLCDGNLVHNCPINPAPEFRGEPND